MVGVDVVGYMGFWVRGSFCCRLGVVLCWFWGWYTVVLLGLGLGFWFVWVRILVKVGLLRFSF